jgi:hypothetical protein
MNITGGFHQGNAPNDKNKVHFSKFVLLKF